MSKIKRITGLSKPGKAKRYTIMQIKKIIMEVTTPITAAEHQLPEGAAVTQELKDKYGYKHDQFTATGEWIRQELFKRFDGGG